MIPASDREINVTVVIAYWSQLQHTRCSAKNEAKTTGDIARERLECRIQFSEKVMSHREYTQNVKN